MPSINQYSTANPLQLGDQIIIWSTNNSDSRKSTVSALIDLVQANIDVGKQAFTTQYEGPTATAFNVQVTNGSDNIWLVLTPAAGYADGTITLPLSTGTILNQEVLVNCTQAVTTLVVAGNGATVVGAPVTLAANDFFKLKYDSVLNRWYRVG